MLIFAKATCDTFIDQQVELHFTLDRGRETLGQLGVYPWQILITFVLICFQLIRVCDCLIGALAVLLECY